MVNIDIKSTIIQPKSYWRDTLAYWLLGLTNSFGYSVMLTAAHDILQVGDEIQETNVTTLLKDTNVRDCNMISTGSVLLADSLPALMITAVASFLPLYPNIRVATAISFGISGLVVVALANTTLLVITGVALVSLGAGLGEVTFISYTSCYNKNTISAWSSGAGASGLLASLAHAGLMSFKFRPNDIMFGMIIIPVVNGIVFWFLLTKPNLNKVEISTVDLPTTTEITKKQKEKIIDIWKSYLHQLPSLMKYAVPTFILYISQYFINQGLTELVEFDGIQLDHNAQYRWTQVSYQIGKLIGQSSGNLVFIDNILLMSLLQVANVALFAVEVVFYIAPYIWLIFILSIWEGLLGGFTFVNTMRRISTEVEFEKRKFALAIATLSNMIGSTLAGFIAIPIHNELCKLYKPTRKF